MSVGDIHMEIVVGEDWTVDILWVDQFGNGIPVQHPCQLTIKAQDNSTLHTLATDPTLPPDVIPAINLSPDIGLIQLHIPSATTVTFPPSEYRFDLFVTTATDSLYGGSQITPVLRGPVTVQPRVTVMT